MNTIHSNQATATNDVQLEAITKGTFPGKVCKAIRDHERNKEVSK